MNKSEIANRAMEEIFESDVMHDGLVKGLTASNLAL